MRAIHTKLRSERGASITFALLLFLVCAVVASVVLTAGTAASGRLSQQAESDRRYYSVSSAARLLQTEIESTAVTATKSGNYAADLSSVSWTVKTQDANAKDIPALLFTAAQKVLGDVTASVPASLTVTATNIPDVTVDVTLDASGTLTLKIHNATGTGDPYTQQLTFALDRRDSVDKNQAADTQVMTASLTWILSDVQTVVQPTPAPGG